MGFQGTLCPLRRNTQLPDENVFVMEMTQEALSPVSSLEYASGSE